jgi:CHAT domain-containing protein
VDDDATVELMRGFYAAVKQHRPIGDALRAAELGVRRTHPEPAYWAPFVATAIE